MVPELASAVQKTQAHAGWPSEATVNNSSKEFFTRLGRGVTQAVIL